MTRQFFYTLVFATASATVTAVSTLSPRTETNTKTFNGYQVLRINSTSIPVQTFLQHLYESDEPGFDFWTAPNLSPDHPTDVALPRRLSAALKNVLEQQFGIRPRVIIENLQELIEQSENDQTRIESAFGWDSYHPLATIHNWLDSLETAYPNNVKVIEIGKSSENRTLKVVKVSFNTDRATAKSAIWMDGGIHAREWVTPATVTYMLNELLNCTTTQDTNSTTESCALAAQFDWYILPVVNPDGYVHSWTKNRMWRKTRSRPAVAPPSWGSTSLWESTLGRCVGVDPNRNFDFVWGGKGTSGNRCSDIYRGPSPASEPEVAALQAFLLSIKDDLKLFLTIHSYSQMILTPWSYDNVEPQDLSELKRVALNAAEAIKKVHGTHYRVDPPPKLLGTAAGSSMDWAKAVAGVKYAYGFELRDTGEHGFILPASQIVPTAEETWAAVQSMAGDIALIYNS